ncbi:4-hydroxybenzoate polyprenyltransferase [Actinoplanes derwentensis]|uniref:4-hydroxybenzoate polyprenyltransferase n=1 Tax=Actinoplanes derwentensis TaxID=113562 RepID=A0A1H1X7X4_9ACTN|nr:UbiA family prenyltransferase [Actinoplanes derwentensis]GID85691.1 transferase [Actinoplanes derwentensis]SDT05210.1 4-hydroxybenzoate polyprenyltransferase [Actinoplanes derwentensis]
MTGRREPRHRTGWRDLVELTRAPAALSVPGDVVAGAAAAGVLRPRTLATAAASVCLYWAGMAANDLADRHVDAVERPHRPIPSGRVSPATAGGIAAGLTVAGLAIAVTAGGRRQIPVAVSLAGAIWLYDLGAKNTVAGPAVMATCRGLNVLLGTGGRWRPAVPSALVVAAHTYTVTVLSQREVEGAEPSLPRRTLAATAAVAVAAAGARSGRRMLGAAALATWYLARYGAAQRRAAEDPTAARVQDAVTAGITTLPVLQGALAARSGAGAAGVATAVLAPAAARLARKVAAT